MARTSADMFDKGNKQWWTIADGQWTLVIFIYRNFGQAVFLVLAFETCEPNDTGWDRCSIGMWCEKTRCSFCCQQSFDRSVSLVGLTYNLSNGETDGGDWVGDGRTGVGGFDYNNTVAIHTHGSQNWPFLGMGTWILPTHPGPISVHSLELQKYIRNSYGC